MTGISIFVALLAFAAAALVLWFYYRDQRAWQVRERDLLRTMREQESAQEALQVANRNLELRARQLARSNAELERFAHVASHDLKEPVRTVISYTQLLSKKYEGVLDEQAREYIRDAAEAARSIRSRIESLLDFSRAGDTEEEFIRTDSRAAVDQAVVNLKPAVDQSAALIRCDALPTVLAHAPEVTLLFQNLIDNAIKFRSAKPLEIRISAERTDNPAQWQFCVRDNGIGIDPRAADKIFGLFQRLHPQERFPGMGMGLPICRKIVESHGGRIWLEPAEGGGSCFLFTLPAPVS